MQNNRFILVGSLLALALCAAPYGCAGKSIEGGARSDGSAQGDGAVPRDGSTHGDGAVPRDGYHSDGGFDGYHSDGGFDGYHGDGVNPADGWSYSDGQGPDGYCCTTADGSPPADGWDDHADGSAPADGWDDHADGSPTADGWDALP
jgi:hypothetical protein